MYTKVESLIWDDEKFKKLSNDGRLLFLYILTCKHRNMLGLYQLPIPYGSHDLGWEMERFSKGLEELLDKEFVDYNYNTNTILIQNFLKYNPLENPNQVKGAIKALDGMQVDNMESQLLTRLKVLDKRLLQPLVERLEERLSKGFIKQVDVDVDVEVDVDEKVIMTSEQEKYISILRGIDNYPLDIKKDLEYMDKLKDIYPTIDIIKSINDFSIWIMDNPFKNNANHRSQINTHFRNNVKWGNNLKSETTIKKEIKDDNPFLNRGD